MEQFSAADSSTWPWEGAADKQTRHFHTISEYHSTYRTRFLSKGFDPIPGSVGDPVTAGTVALAFFAGLWSYDGWNNLNFVTEEIKNPSRNLPLAISIGIPFTTALYVLAFVSYLTILAPMEVINSEAVANEWATRFLFISVEDK